MEQQKYKLRLGLYGLLGFVALLLVVAAVFLAHGAPAVAVASAIPIAVKAFYAFLQSLGR